MGTVCFSKSNVLEGDKFSSPVKHTNGPQEQQLLPFIGHNSEWFKPTLQKPGIPKSKTIFIATYQAHSTLRDLSLRNG